MTQVIDVNSPTWKTVSEKASAALEKSCKATERRGIDERDADYERGRCAALREILALGDPPKAAPEIKQPLQY